MMNITCGVIVFLCAAWSCEAFSTYSLGSVPHSHLSERMFLLRGTNGKSFVPSKGTEDQNTKYQDKILLEDILSKQTQQPDFQSFKSRPSRLFRRHDLSHNNYKTTIYPAKRNFKEEDGADISGLSPLISLDLLGNMKQFFTGLKNSVKEDYQEEYEENVQHSYKPSPFIENHKGMYSRTLKTRTPFEFPQHMRRKMFGTPKSQHYAHSGLGR